MFDELAFRRFKSLFDGNTTCYGTEHGSCVRSEVTSDSYRGHITGESPIGIYPMTYQDERWLVRWGCVDLDVKADHKRRWDYETPEDAFVASQNLVLSLQALGMMGWTESTKSGGYHVWVFASEWVLAATMRRALLVACKLSDVPPTEVNPKSEGFVDTGMVGNYVRLPYKGLSVRPIINSRHEPLDWADFVEQATQTRVGTPTLEEAASLWVPQAPLRVVTEPTGTRFPAELGGLSKRLTAVVTNGPLKKEDRSGWLYYVARLCADDGLSQSEAIEIVTDCDWNHTHKFEGRNDGPLRITSTVERAYR